MSAPFCQMQPNYFYLLFGLYAAGLCNIHFHSMQQKVVADA